MPYFDGIFLFMVLMIMYMYANKKTEIKHSKMLRFNFLSVAGVISFFANFHNSVKIFFFNLSIIQWLDWLLNLGMYIMLRKNFYRRKSIIFFYRFALPLFSLTLQFPVSATFVFVFCYEQSDWTNYSKVRAAADSDFLVTTGQSLNCPFIIAHY